MLNFAWNDVVMPGIFGNKTVYIDVKFALMHSMYQILLVL